MRTARRPRLSPETFQLPVEKMRAGYYSDAYFTFTREVLERDAHHPRVLMQVFQRERSVLGGMDEALAILRLCSGRYDGGRDGGGEWIPGWDELDVRALHDGDEIEPWETVLTIEGDYALFCHLETLYLGVLARRTLISRNVRDVVAAAAGKPILYFPARFDHWQVQTGDGWAAHIAGAIGVSTDAQASWWGGKGMGTVPHGLIAAYGGDTVRAARTFADRFADELSVTVLVDFENDSVRTALEVADALGDRLWGVRLDTSNTMVDRSLWHEMGRFRPTGVVPELVWNVRRALDGAGHGRVRIVASGGFTAERIREFEEADVPVDAYGVGSALLLGANDFTADVVRVNGRPCAKVGREERPNPRLEPVILT
jgi:nicotinate phosphoribosyltransferase